MKKILTLTVFCSLASSSFAEIAMTDNYNTIMKAINNADKDSLVIFDVDDVLISPTPEYSFAHPIRKKLAKKYEAEMGENEAKILWSNVLRVRKIKYLDPKIPEIFSNLSQRKIPAIALTKCFTGKYGTMQNAEDWRIKELKSMNINFDKLSPIKSNVAFSDIVPVNGRPSSTPMLKQGVIFTARSDKGMILERVFKHYNYYPKKIIFIDDKYKNLESVENLAKKYNIKFTGYMITATTHFSHLNLSSEKEELRFKILKKEGKWVSD